MTALREIIALVDIDAAKAISKIKNVDGLVGNLKAHLGTLASTAFGAFSASKLKDFVHEQIELGSTLNDTAERLGIGTDELQKFQYAAGLSGVNAEEAAKGLQFLNRNIGEALGGSKESVQQFAAMGIQLKDTHGDVRELGDIVPEVADAFAKMGSDQERTAAAMKIFGRSGAALIPMLKGGSEGLKELSKQFEDLELGIKEDFIKAADDAGDALDTLKLGLRSLKTRIAVELFPTLTEWTKKGSQIVAGIIRLTRQTYIVKEAIGALGIAAGAAGIKAALGWGKFFGIIPKGGGFWKTLLGLGEFAVVIGLVAALALGIEDLFVMLNGGQSVIGDFLTETYGIEYTNQLIAQMKDAFGSVEGSLRQLLPVIKDVGKEIIDISVNALPVVIGLFVDLVKVAAAATHETVGFLNALGKLKDFDFAGAGEELITADKKAMKLFAGGSATIKAIDATTSPSVPSSQVRQPTGFARGDLDMGDTTIQVTVNGGPSNEGTARAVAGAIRGTVADEKRQAAASLWRGAEDE